MSLSAIMKRLLNDKYKALYKAGYLDKELNLTCFGKLALTQIVAEKFETEFIARAQEKIAENA